MEMAMELLQSYCNDSRAVKCKEEDFQTLRTALQKIVPYLNSSESRNRFLTHPSYIPNLIYALQTFPDRNIRILLVRLFFRLLSKSGFKKYAVSLVQKGLTRALFQALFLESTENTPNEEFMLRIHQLLCRLGPFDRRFGIRARLNQCLPITLCLLRSQIALLGSHFSASSTSSSGPTSTCTSTLASSTSSCGTGTAGSVGLNVTGPMCSASSTTTTSTMSSNLVSAGSTASPGTGSGLAAGTSHGTASGGLTTTPMIPNALNRQLTIVLRTIRLYVSGFGKNNASSLGRSGAVGLLLRLLVIAAGLPVPKSIACRISPSMSMSTSAPGVSVGCGGPSGSLAAALTGSAAVGLANTGLTSAGAATTLSSSITSNNTESHPTPSLGRVGTENGLVIGSPIVTAVTTTASAAASLQRYRMRTSNLSRATKGCAPPPPGYSSSGSASMGFLATTAASLLSTTPAFIATGIRYHSNFLRLVINTLHSLIRWKHNATRAINAGAMGVMLDLFLDVHRCDLHRRRIPLQRSALACLKCLTVTRAGRKMFIQCGGLHSMFAVCAGYVGPDPLNRNDGDGTLLPQCNPPKGSVPSRSGGVLRNRIPGSVPPKYANPSHRASSTTTTSTATLNVKHPAIRISRGGSLSSETYDYSPPLPTGLAGGFYPSPTLESLTSMTSTPSANSKPSISSVGGVASGDNGFISNVPVSSARAGIKRDDLNTVLIEACMLLRRCCPRSRLPVATAEGIFRCPLRREQSDAKSLPRDRCQTCLVDNTSLSNGPCSGGKKDERKSVRLSPRMKEQSLADCDKRLGDRRSFEHAPLSNEAVPPLYTSNQANELADECVARLQHSAAGRKRPTDQVRLIGSSTTLSVNVKSKHRTSINRPQRMPRQKTNTIKPVHNTKIIATLKSHTDMATSCLDAKGLRNSEITVTMRRRRPGRPTWPTKRGTKSGRKMDTKSEAVSCTLPIRSTPRPWLSSTRIGSERITSPKTQSSSKRPHSLLSSSQIASGHLPSPSSPHARRGGGGCSGCDSSSDSMTTAEFAHGKHHVHLPRGSDRSFASHTAPCSCGAVRPVSGRSPSFTGPADDDDDEHVNGDLIVGGDERVHQSTDYDDDGGGDDDDDDDGEDDLDDDDDGREADSGLDEPGAATRAVSLTDLIKSHGRFFPEWIDLPEEIPPSVTQDQLLAALDPTTTDWPFTAHGESDPGIVHHIDPTNELFTCSMKQATDPDTVPANTVEQAPMELPVAIRAYLCHARHTQALVPFSMIAYPDLIGAVGAPYIEPFYTWLYQSGGDVPATDHANQPKDNSNVMSDISTPTSEMDNNQSGEPVTNANSSDSNHFNSVEYLTVPPTDTHRRSRTKPTKTVRRCTSPKPTISPQKLTTRPRRATHPSIGTKTTQPGDTLPRLPYSLIGLPHAEILDDVRRLIDPDDVLYRTVFDLDETVLASVRELQRRNISTESPRATTCVAGSIAKPIDHPEGNTSGTTSPALPQANSQLRSSPIPFRPSATPESQRVSAAATTGATAGYSYTGGGFGDGLLTNDDEAKIDHFDLEKGFLNFDSRFECGNLRKAIQVRQFEYDLILSPDVNTISNLQWFYFRVSNVESGVEYRFNIINCEKPGSQYTAGMQPLLFSVREALEGRPYWVRAGTCVNYYRNHFLRRSNGKHSADGSTYHTATFLLRFPHTGDVCYVAYHYPYTYTRLLTDIARWQNQANTVSSTSQPVYFRVNSLTTSLLENPVPVITVTAGQNISMPVVSRNSPIPDSDQACDSLTTQQGSTTTAKPQRPYIFLTARVHSGEANSSWVMQGLMDRLVSDDPVAVQARQKFIFKIVPMLNPDGVICGNHRCSMAGKDLNRRWSNPSSINHPTIYHTKKLLQVLFACNRSPFVFIDLHGHSRMKNIFLYGCSPLQSWKNPDTNNPTFYRGGDLVQEDLSYQHLATLLDELAPAFSKRSCSYAVSKAKETTARVAVWREFRVVRSYTIEATYCGVTQFAGHPTSALDPSKNEDHADGPLRYPDGHQIGPAHLNAFGAHLLAAFVRLPTCAELSLPSTLATGRPTTPVQFFVEVDSASLTDRHEHVAEQLPTLATSEELIGHPMPRSPPLDSVGSLPSSSSGGSSAHSLCFSSGASSSARSSSSQSSLSSSCMTDG